MTPEKIELLKLAFELTKRYEDEWETIKTSAIKVKPPALDAHQQRLEFLEETYQRLVVIANE